MGIESGGPHESHGVLTARHIGVRVGNAADAVGESSASGTAEDAELFEVLLQAGGYAVATELETEGVNGYCGPVEFTSIDVPAGVSFKAPAVTAGQVARVELSAAPDAPVQNGVPMVLHAAAPDVTGADAALRITVLPSRGDIWLRAFSGACRSSVARVSPRQTGCAITKSTLTSWLVLLPALRLLRKC